MAKINQRTWRVPGTRTKRKAWGYTAQAPDGKQKRVYRAEWTKDAAEKALAAWQLGIGEQKAAEAASAAVGTTLGDAVTRYLGMPTARGNDRSRDERRILEHLKAAFGSETPLAALTAARISEYKAGRLGAASVRRKDADGNPRKLSPASINRPLATLRHLLRLAAEEWEVLPRVPTIKLEREREGRLKWLPEDAAVRLLDACRRSRNADLADLVEFCLFTGVRRGEALALTWERVDRARGVIRIEVSKSGYRRDVPLNANADAVLAGRWTDGARGYVFGSRNWNRFRTAWESAVAAAGVEDFHFHDLRHTFASWLVQRGRTMKEVQDALGHRTLAMTNRYAHLAPEHLRAAVGALDGVLPASSATSPTQGSAQEADQLIGVSQKSA